MASVTNEDPKDEANYRFARGAAIILGVLIVIALIALVLGFAFRSPHRADAVDASGVTHLALPAGARVLSMDLEPGRIVLRVRSAEGEEIDIIDTANGRLVGQVKVPANPEAPKR